MELTSPDVLLLVPEWPERALMRAELIEAGYNVVAIDVWPIPGLYRRPGMKPRVAIVDLRGISEPRAVLDELRSAMTPDRVLVITSLGTVTADEVNQIGCHAMARPTSVRDIVAAAAGLLRADPS